MGGAFVVNPAQAAAEQARYTPRIDTAIVEVDAIPIDGKSALLLAVATAMAFPRYFRPGWDSLSECLSDLTWLPASAFLVVIRNARKLWERCPGDALKFVEVWLRCARSWQAEGVPFRLVLAWQARTPNSVPVFEATSRAG